MGLIEKSMLERWEIAKIETRLDKAKSIEQQKVCCTSNITDDESQTIEPMEWIACSERMPSENGDYLVTLENGVVKILGYSTIQRTTYPKGFYHIKDGCSWRQVQNPVVAWMPLPEPWKGADNNCGAKMDGESK